MGQRERESYVCVFALQMLPAPKSGVWLGWSQELGIQSGIPPWVALPEAGEPSPTVSHSAHLHKAGIESEVRTDLICSGRGHGHPMRQANCCPTHVPLPVIFFFLSRSCILSCCQLGKT